MSEVSRRQLPAQRAVAGRITDSSTSLEELEHRRHLSESATVSSPVLPPLTPLPLEGPTSDIFQAYLVPMGGTEHQYAPEGYGTGLYRATFKVSSGGTGYYPSAVAILSDMPALAATPTAEEQGNLPRELQSLFRIAREERFEAGMESHFAKELLRVVDRFGEDAVAHIASLIHNPTTSGLVASEALQWLARSDHGPSLDRRRAVLEGALTHTSHVVRDGAVLGLFSLGDPMSIPAVRAAARVEPVPELKSDMEQFLAEFVR
jgi:hypothetical protein